MSDKKDCVMRIVIELNDDGVQTMLCVGEASFSMTLISGMLAIAQYNVFKEYETVSSTHV